MRISNDRGFTSTQLRSNRVGLQLIDLFISVYRTRNLTHTGLQLGLSQPAVSRGLGRLREAYGDPLFVRRQRGVQPTPFADHLAEPLAAALSIVQGTIERPKFEPSTDDRRFRIAMTDIGERYFLPRLLRQLASAAPRVSIETVSPALAELKSGLASGDVDLVVSFLPQLGKQVRELRLFRERFVYLARNRHPIVRGKLTREMVRELPHVVVATPGTRHAAEVERVLTSSRMKVPVALRVRSFLCVGPIVAESDLIAAVPNKLAELVAASLKLQRIDPPLQIPGFDVSMGWHQRFHRDPGNEWMRAQFVDLFQALPASG
jgi:DNA-binding transcriptional LysR family regulator